MALKRLVSRTAASRIVLAASVAAAVFIVGRITTGEAGTHPSGNLPTDAAVELPMQSTLREVLVAGYRLLDTWGPGWYVIELESTDDGDDTASETSGADGRRGAWVLRAASTDGEERLVRLAGGRVRGIQVAGTGAAKSAAALGALSASVGIDSPEAVATARNLQPTLRPSADPKGLGYQFAVALDPVTARAVVIVRGSDGAEAARVTFDAASGAFVAAERLELAYGIQVSNDAGQSWNPPIGVTGSPISLAASRNGRVYDATLAGTTVTIMRWSGTRWETVAELPPAAGSWVRGLAAFPVGGDSDRVVVAAESGLWSVRTDAPGGPEEIATGSFTRVAFSGTGDLNAIRVTSPGSTEQVWVDHVGRLALVDSGTSAQKLAVLSGVVTAFGYESQAVLGLSGVLTLAGSGSDLMAWSTTAGFVQSRDGGASWAKVNVPGEPVISEVVFSPNWSTSGVALAREYRGAMWRTSDHGQSWAKVLNETGEMTGTVFGPERSVFALTGGIAIWQPF